MDDNSRMPYGKYINTKMANVPAHYLLWLHREGKCSGEVKRYIEDNMEILKEEVKNNETKK